VLEERREEPVGADGPQQQDRDAAVEPRRAGEAAQALTGEQDEDRVLRDVEDHQAVVDRRGERRQLAVGGLERRDELAAAPDGEAEAEQGPGEAVLAHRGGAGEDERRSADEQQELGDLVVLDREDLGASDPLGREHEHVHRHHGREHGPCEAYGARKTGIGGRHPSGHRQDQGVCARVLDVPTSARAPGSGPYVRVCGRAPARSR
jgi:hypothetical protein